MTKCVQNILLLIQGFGIIGWPRKGPSQYLWDYFPQYATAKSFTIWASMKYSRSLVYGAVTIPSWEKDYYSCIDTLGFILVWITSKYPDVEVGASGTNYIIHVVTHFIDKYCRILLGGIWHHPEPDPPVPSFSLWWLEAVLFVLLSTIP